MFRMARGLPGIPHVDLDFRLKYVLCLIWAARLRVIGMAKVVCSRRQQCCTRRRTGHAGKATKNVILQFGTVRRLGTGSAAWGLACLFSVQLGVQAQQ